ncbi:MAG: CARDB domain-containing protein [Ignisphaera sp.]
MNRRSLAIVIAIIMLPTIVSIDVSKAQSTGLFTVVAVMWGSLSSPLCVGPGMQTQRLTIMLKYNGNDTLAGLRAELYLPWYLRDALSKTSVAESRYTQVIARNQITELAFWIDVGERASAGDYTADLILYTYRNGLWEEIDRLTITLTLIYTDKIYIKTQSPTKVYPGRSNLSIYIENQGSGYAYGASIEVSTSLQQISVINPSIDVGDIPPNSAANIYIPIYVSPSLIGSLAPLYLRMSYIDACGFSRTFNTVMYLSIEQPKEPQITVRVTPTTLTAGVENNVRITIANNGTSTTKGLTISFDLPQQIALGNKTTRIVVDELKPGSSVEATLILTPIGITSDRIVVQAYATLSYRDQYDISRGDRIAILFTVIQPQTLLTIDIQPQNLTAGRINNVSISIENIGDAPVYSVGASIAIPQSMVIKGFDGKWHVGDLKPGERKSLTLYIAVPTTATGSVQIGISLTYIDISSIPRTEARSIGLSITSVEKPLLIQVVPWELDYGENNIDVVIANSGRKRVSNVSITITSPQLIIKGYGNRWYMGELKPGEQQSLRLPVFVPSSAGPVAQLTLSIEYRDVTGTLISENIVYGLMVRPVTTLLTATIEPEQILPGENNVTIRIRNDGSRPVYNLLVTIIPQQAIAKESDGKWFVGDLYPGEVANTTLSLIVPSAAGSIQIGITLSYIDVGGATKSESRSLGLIVRQPLINIAMWAEPQNLSIGENDITVYIRNDGDVTIHDMLVSFTPSQQVVFVGSGGRIYIDKIDPRASRTFTLKLTVTATTGATILQIPVAISYVDPGNSYRSENRVLSFKVCEQPTPINLRVSAEPQTIVSGRYSALNLTIVNTAGRRLDNVSMTISSGSLALIGSNNRWYLGSLEPGEAKTISLAVYTNPTQTIQNIIATATFTYINTATGSLTSEVVQFTVLAMPEYGKRYLEIGVSPQILVAGQTNKLTISLRNPNNFEVSSVTLSIAPPTGGILLSPDTYFTDLLKPGDKVSIEVPIYIQSTSGTTLSIPLTISYFDGTTTVSLSKSLAFLISLPPTLRVTSYAVLPQTISPGQTFSVSLTLANTGLGSAYNVTVRALPSHIYTPLLGAETLIGEIAKGGSTTVTFSFRLSTTVNATALRPANITRTRTIELPPTVTRTDIGMPSPQAMSLPSISIWITYMDNVGKQYNTTLSIPLTIAAGAPTTVTHTAIQSPTINTALLAIALPVGLALIYLIIRLRRR